MKILELEIALKLSADSLALKKVDFAEAMEEANFFIGRVFLLEEENEKFRKLLFENQHQKTVRKTSRNSDLPPSKDVAKNVRDRSNSRVKSGKKVGGQPGHKGHTLEMSENPTHVIPLVPNICDKCGKPLDPSKKKLVDSRQEIDIPPAMPIIRQFDRYEVPCKCGNVSIAAFPENITAKTQYGPQVRATINYMSTFQLIPFARLKELFDTFFGIKLSTGTLVNSIKRSAVLSQETYLEIKDFLARSPWLGGDETFITVNGKTHYLWAWQNDKASFIVYEISRCKKVIYKHFSTGFPAAVYVSDRYAAHLSTPTLAHQVCWAHLLRKLIYLEDAEDNPWIHLLEKLFRTAESLDKMKSIWTKKDKQTIQLEKQLNKLLVQYIDPVKFPKTCTLQKKLLEVRHMLFTFLYYEGVPFHNNGTERVFRMSKVKLKVSGQFKALAQEFAVNRSVIDTIIKNGLSVFDSLYKIESGQKIDFAFA